MKAKIRILSRKVISALDRGLDAKAPKCSIAGVTVVDRYSRDDSATVLPQMRQALQFLERADPVNWRRLINHVSRITIAPLRAGGYFVRQRDEIIVRGKTVAEENLSAVVLILIHEIAHARVAAATITNVTLEERTREEVLCERRVRAFLDRMALSDSAWAEFRDHYNSKPLPTALSLQDLRQLRQDDSIEELRHLQAPGWLISTFQRLRPAQGSEHGDASV